MLSNVHVPDAVTVSPLSTVANVMVQLALVPPSYVLSLQLDTVGVNDFLPILNVPFAYVIE